MIYAKHDFKQNLQNAIRFDDKEAVLDVVFNEISDKYSKNKQGIVSAIRKSGVKISDNPSNKKLATVIVENINNKPFAENIFASFRSEPYSNADASFVTGAVLGIAVTALVKSKRSKEEMKQDVEGFVKQLDSKTGSNSGNKKPLLVGAAIIGSLLLVAYIVTKK